MAELNDPFVTVGSEPKRQKAQPAELEDPFVKVDPQQVAQGQQQQPSFFEMVRSGDARIHFGEQKGPREPEKLRPRERGIQTPFGTTPEVVSDALAGVTNSLTFGAADELGATGATIISALNPFDGIDQIDLEHMQGITQELRDQRREDRPGLSIATELAGAVTSGAAVGGAAARGVRAAGAASSSLPTRLVTTAGTGAAEGGATGFLEADSNRAGSAASGALLGSVFGSIFGIGAPPMLAATRAAGGDVVSTTAGQAEKIVGRIAREMNLSPEQIRDQIARLGPEATLLDLDAALRATAAGSGNKSVQAVKLLTEFTEARHLRSPERVRLFMEQAGGSRAGRFGEFSETMTARRAASAEKMYGPIRGLPIDGQLIDPIFDNPLGKRVLRTAAKEADGNTGRGTLQYYDEVKRVIDDQISKAQRQGRRNLVRKYTTMRNAMVDELDAQVPEYKLARRTFERASELLDAANLGAELFRAGPDRINELTKLLADMPPSQRGAFRIGAMEAANRLIRAAGPDTNLGRRFNSNINQERIGLLSVSDEAAEKASEQLLGEQQQFLSRQLGSQSAPGSRTQLIAGPAEQMDRLAGIGSDAVRASQGDLMAASRVVSEFLGGAQVDGTHVEIVRLLTRQGWTVPELTSLLAKGQPPPALISDINTALRIAGASGAVSGQTSSRLTGGGQPQQ